MGTNREFIPFRFRVNLIDKEADEILCLGHFSEVSGIEVNMEPRAIQQGGQNWGEVQRVGQTRFSPIVLRRGVTDLNDLWVWFDTVTRASNYGYRLDGNIEVLANKLEPADATDSTAAPEATRSPTPDTEVVMKWKLEKVLPTRFKAPDLSSTANQVAIEEITLVHESITLEQNLRARSA